MPLLLLATLPTRLFLNITTMCSRKPPSCARRIYKRTSGDGDDKEMIVFTHRPCTAPGKLYHRFMKDMLSPESVLDELPDYVMHYFCGHIHHVAQFEQHGIKVSTAPGIQCQIDPYANECVAYPIPGYQVITFEGFRGSIVNIETVILNEEK